MNTSIENKKTPNKKMSREERDKARLQRMEEEKVLSAAWQKQLVPTGDATAMMPVENGKQRPITVIGNETIRKTFDARTYQQAMNSRMAPGVSDLVLNPDAHAGYGAPIGCVISSPSHIYPGPVGVDIKCSMSLLQLDLPAEAVEDKKTRRALIDAILLRVPTGAGRGMTQAPKARKVHEQIGRIVAVEGATKQVCELLEIPRGWRHQLETAAHVGHDETSDSLRTRLELLINTGKLPSFNRQVAQLGSYGGGNHFGECEIVHLCDNDRARSVGEHFGLRDGHVAFLSHCGSRGFGYALADGQFKLLQEKFKQWSIPLPGNDPELVYAPLGTQQADDYICDMSLGANFATVNHMLINALVLEAFQEVIPGVQGKLVYHISHNIAQKEVVPHSNNLEWVHRKGATRAYPAGHHALKGSPFESTGHPILLPGNPQAGSSVMVANDAAILSNYSVNHGAGRAMGRRHAASVLDQKTVDQSFEDSDILSNCRKYPIDEAPAAYKDFNEVIKSVQQAGLASEVARLKARFVIKDTAKGFD